MTQTDQPQPAPLPEAADGILAGRAAGGDVQAFEVLVRRHGAFMHAYATQLLRSSAEADDAVQDALITAWDKLPELRDPATVRAWLLRITSRKAYDVIRRRREDAPLDDHDAPLPPSAQPDRLSETWSARDALREALDRLPDQQRRCWLLREVGGLSYDEIAAELEVPPSTVRGAIARARRTLMREMEAWR